MLIQPRYTHAQFQVLGVLRSLPKHLLHFPLDMKAIIKTVNNCKIASYEAFAQKFDTSVDDVVVLCSSKTGCTHYEICSGKYLILYNNSLADYNVDGRQRWTLAHELAHVVLKHLLIEPEASAAENSFSSDADPVVESEADFFAAQILAPLPLFGPLNISSSIEVQKVFGLSSQASLNQYNKYLKWKRNHVKTSFENDLIKLFTPFINNARL